jgi:hypothetical protein
MILGQLASQKLVSTHSCISFLFQHLVDSISYFKSQWTSYHVVKEAGQRPLTGVESEVFTKVAIRVIYTRLHCSYLHPHEQTYLLT